MAKLTAGVDIGSTTAQAVIMNDSQIVAYSNIRCSYDSAETARKCMNEALAQAGLSLPDIGYVVGTGYGRFIVPFAQKNISEISCHARGAHHFFPEVRSILDMGGQDCKFIRCDGVGKVTEFVMNEKCAAGCGRSMEVLADVMGVSLADIGPLALQAEHSPPEVSGKCVVFARTEALGLLRRHVPRNAVIAGYVAALSKRIANLAGRLGVSEQFVISGGIGKNVGVVENLRRLLHTEPHIAHEPQIVGAVGAALFAQALSKK